MTTDHPDPLRVITVRQPWAEAIAEAEDNPAAKLVENRSRGFPSQYRGLVAIHAGQAPSLTGARSPLVRDLLGTGWSQRAARGAVIAVADLVDVHPSAGCCRPWGEDTYPHGPSGEPVTQVTHLRLERVVSVRPVEARGKLGLWRPDTDLLLEVCHRLAERITWDEDGAHYLADCMDITQLHSVVAADVALPCDLPADYLERISSTDPMETPT